MSSFLRAGLFVGALCWLSLAAMAPAFAQTTPSRTANGAPQGTINLSQPLGSQRSVTGLNDYIRAAYRYALAIVTTVAIVMITYGGFRYLIGSTSGDIAKGKEIIYNALIGMLLVFGAYLILQTVNPQTLTLRVPSLETIRPQSLPAPITSCNVRTLAVDSPSCAVDTDCGSSGSCFRFGYYSVENTDPGFLSGVTGAVGIRTGGVSGSVNSLASGGLYDGDTSNRGGGKCSLGAEGQLCRCSGFGCRLTTPYAGTSGPSSQYARDLAGSPWNKEPSDEDYLTSLAALQRDARLTNNAGQGWASCRSGLSCTFQSPTGYPPAWYCMGVPTRTGGRPGSVTVRNCVQDSECENGQVCLRTDSAAGTNQGECSPRDAATLGARCGCSRYGCQGSLPARNPSGAVVITTNFTHCAPGLVCALFNYSDHNDAAPPVGDWFCATATSADDQFLSASCRGSASSTSAGPISGHCGYSCERTGSSPSTPSVSVTCSGDTQAAADSVCSTACGSGANSCSTLFPGSTCSNPRCVPDAAPAAH